ncbi:inactive ubiquitin carboxyl-terminal hydrolase MINDY-4B [Prinia subflava]|uniref:inactive ubiquitin carboxyl-terminal hydrolase MINDY-4B n=1 Tax=Prinia subflava TaxID=208062 RepID=UPI002FE257D6
MRGLTLAPPSPQRLQKLLFRNSTPLFSSQWAAARFSFHQAHSDLAYALEAGQGGTGAIVAAVQAHIITYLLFTRETESTHLERLCQVGRGEQGQALATALAETLWAAGGGGRAVVCLVTAPVTVTPREGCRANSFTERIRLFEFSEKAAAQGFISDHINCAVLSLLLTGRARPRALGGTGDPERGAGDGHGEPRGQRGPEPGTARGPGTVRGSWHGPGSRHGPGFLARPGVPGTARGSWHGPGFLALPGVPGTVRGSWHCPGFLARPGVPGTRPPAQVSPALRTPRLPVWLCSLSGRHSVLFGTDSRLLSDWKSERIFHLYFHSGQQEQTRTAHLTIGTDPGLPGTEVWASQTTDWVFKIFLDISFSFPFQTLIHITGKRLREKGPAAQGGGAQPWRWQSGPSGPVRPSAGTGPTPSSEERPLVH